MTFGQARRHPMSTGNKIIGVLGVGEVPNTVLKVIAAHVTGYLNLRTEVLSPLAPPFYAQDPVRAQYDAAKILARLESMPFPNHGKVIGILNADLFVPIFTHVFGEARQGGRVALISIYRLGNPPGFAPPSHVVLERAAKIALHELGHLFNQTHCEDTRCLMHFSGSLEDLDHTAFDFCRYCTASFRLQLRRYFQDGGQAASGP